MTHSSLVKQSIYFYMYYFRCFLGWKTPYLGNFYQINSFLVFSIGWESIVMASVRFSLNFSLFNWFANANDDLSILISIPLFQSLNSPKAEFQSLPHFSVVRLILHVLPRKYAYWIFISFWSTNRYLAITYFCLKKARAYHCHISVTWLRMNINKN